MDLSFVDLWVYGSIGHYGLVCSRTGVGQLSGRELLEYQQVGSRGTPLVSTLVSLIPGNKDTINYHNLP